MTAFVIRKFLQAVLLLLAVLVINFFILRLTPGNPYDAQQYALLADNNGRPLTSYQQYQLSLLKKRLDIYYKPAPEAFLQWAGGIVRGDFGNSAITGLSITENLWNVALNSLWLFLLASGFGLTLGLVLGLYGAYRPGTWQDNAIKIVTLVFIALPGWYMYSVIDKLNKSFAQLSGVSVLGTCQGRFCQTLATGFLLPVFLLGAILLALVWGQTRTQAIAVLQQDYIRTARSKGLKSRRIMWRHVLRNSLTPVVSIFGGLLPFVFASQILVEISSRWNGLGSSFLYAARARDYTILMGIFTLLVFVCVMCSFLSEVALAALDPKTREQYQGGVQLGKLAGLKQVRPRWRRPVPIGVGLAVLVAGIAAFIVVNPLAEKAGPVAINPTSTVAPTVGGATQPPTTYTSLKLPADATILLQDIKVGERKPVLSIISSSGTPAGKPAFNTQVETKQTIFGTKAEAIRMMIEIRKGLEADGWIESKNYKYSTSQFIIDSLFEKGDKLLWFGSFGLYLEIGSKNLDAFKENYPGITDGLWDRPGKGPTVIAAAIEGYKPGTSPPTAGNGPATKPSYDSIKLPADTKVLQTDTKTGERKSVLTLRSTYEQPAGKPDFNTQVESQLVIFSSKSGSIPMAVEIRKTLEADGWVESKSYKNMANTRAIDYVFEKGDKLLWVNSFDVRSEVGQKNWKLFKRAYPAAANSVGIGPRTIVGVVQGYKFGTAPPGIRPQ